MSRHLLRLTLPCLVVLCSCASPTRDTAGSIGELRHTGADLTDVKIDGSTDLAIRSYREFLDRTSESGMTPEALRRLADLKIQKEYGTFEGVKRNQQEAARREASTATKPPEPLAPDEVAVSGQPKIKAQLNNGSRENLMCFHIFAFS